MLLHPILGIYRIQVVIRVSDKVKKEFLEYVDILNAVKIWIYVCSFSYWGTHALSSTSRKLKMETILELVSKRIHFNK
jgi:hypothetical protein